MKKKVFGFIVAMMLLVAATAMTALGCNTGEKIDYTVTVRSADRSPVPGITVSWCVSNNERGKATTDDDGIATASLTAGTYEVKLSGYDEGLDYTSVSVTSASPSVILTLTVAQVEYTATVIDKTGAPAANVTVSWLDGETTKGTAKTDTSGVAKCELPYGTYSVMVSNLPEGNVFMNALEATGKSPATRFELSDGQTVAYSVTVRSEGGLLFKNQDVSVWNSAGIVMPGKTNDSSVFAFNLPAGNYTVRTILPEGYTALPATLTATNHTAEIVGVSTVLPKPDTNIKYVIGDIIHDYSFTTPYAVDGERKSYSISEILEEKDAVLINNWGTQCTYCVKEMPALDAAYKTYGDSIEVLAVSNYNGGDTDAQIVSFYEQYRYSFPMMRDTNGFNTKFEIGGWPTTIVIDRYGAIAHIEQGAIDDEEVWGRLIERFIGDDYVQTFTPGDKVSDSIMTEVSKPDVVVPADHYDKIGDIFTHASKLPANTTVTWKPETEYEYAWPFIYGAVDGVSVNGENVLYSSNGGRPGNVAGKPNSMSIIYADVKVPAGKVFTFDYWAQTEEDRDELSIVWDGKIIKQISGESHNDPDATEPEWVTCYLYADLTDDTHSLAITYIKDQSVNTGNDNVYFKNFRFTELTEIGSADMFRAAAYGTPAPGALMYPHYAEVELNNDDGYYYVKTSSLQNSQFAGTDESPMLFANVLNATNWSGTSLSTFVLGQDADTNEYLYELSEETRAKFTKYFQTALSSYVEYCVPVDEELHDLLVAFTKQVAEKDKRQSHANEWLELCYFYSHYGDGDPVGNPIMGVTEKTAKPATAGVRIAADLNRNTAPFPIEIYSFIPTESAVYEIQSYLASSSQQASQIWIYDDTNASSSDRPLLTSGDERFVRDGKNEQNFDVHCYLTKGKKYYIAVAFLMAGKGTFEFDITNTGKQEVSILTPASQSYFEYENGDMSGNIILGGAIQYGKGEDGYYRVKNADGTLGDYIYLDVQYPPTVSNFSFNQLVEQKLRDPYDSKVELEYMMFDFRYRIAYRHAVDENGDDIIEYDPKFELTNPENDDKRHTYKDYTADFKTYVAKAANQHATDSGLIKVNDEMKEMLSMFIELRLNMLLGDSYEHAYENEWLRFCWYYKTISESNPF